MKIGKMPAAKLEEIVLNKIGYKRDDVLVHAGIGEDCSVVDLNDQLLVISSDPITGASKNAGYLAVHVACNDIAAAGAEPIGIQVILLLPEEIDEVEIANLMNEITETAASINVEVLGGHTEILSAVSKPIICVTAVGKVEKDKVCSSADAMPGDDIVVTKGVGIEGTYILANDYSDLLKENGVSVDIIENALTYKNKLSVINESRIAVRHGANAMHDITEGGLYGALEEVSQAAEVGFDLYMDNLPISEETEVISGAMKIDPAGLISSGSMLITVPESEDLLKELKCQGIKAAKIGIVTEKEKNIIISGEKKAFVWSNKDELWRLME
ncbi:MAG: AIR synthase family protein [Halanaerobiales bacterium]